MAFLAGIGAWLQSKLGAILGSIILWVLERLLTLAQATVKTYLYWKRREAAQKKKLEAVEQDVQEERPRDQKTRKDEEDWLNS